MKYSRTLCCLILLMSASYLCAQTQFSALIPNSDTSISFNVIPVAQEDKAYLVRDVFLAGFSTFGYRYGGVEGFSITGEHLFSQRLDPAIEQVMQLVGKRCALGLDEKLLVATDQTSDFDLDPQTAVLWCLDALGNKLWTFEPNISNSISSCGTLLAGNTSTEFYYFFFRTNNSNGNQYLDVLYLNTEGTVLWSKSIFMPLSAQREYLYPTSAVKLENRVVVCLSYGTTSGGSASNEAVSIDLQGNLIGFEPVPNTLGSPILSATNGAIDTFWVASNFKAGPSEIYPCLNGFGLNFSQNVETTCQSNLPGNLSLKPEDFRVDATGNKYMVGSDPFATQYLGWLTKLNPEGEVLWNKFYRFSDAFPDGVCRFNALNFTSNSGLIIAGTASEYNAPSAKDYDWLLTLDANGCFNGDCADTITIPSVVVASHNIGASGEDITVYPNPARDRIYLKNANENASYSFFKLFDVSGKVILTERITNAITTMNIPATTISGLYFWTLNNGQYGVAQGRLIIMK